MSSGLISSLGSSAASAGGAAATEGAATGAATGAASGAMGGAATGAAEATGATGVGGGSGGGWLGTGLFKNDQYNPNPNSYTPTVGSAQSAMPKRDNSTSIALQMLSQMPMAKPSNWSI